MAFPTIPTAGASTLLQSNQATATTTHTFPSLTTLAQAAGDLMIAVIVTYQGGSANAEFSGWGGGFTEFVDQSANSTTVQSIGAAYKFATGSETGTFTVTTVASTRSVMFLMTIPGAHASTLPEATAKANGTAAAANPAALDPANWAAEDTLWIAVGVNGETSLTGSFTGITAAPTNYTGYLDSGIIGGDVIGALEGAVAFRQFNAASEDVGTFSLDVGAAGNSALLLAVRPAPEGFTGAVAETQDDQTSSASGTVVDPPTATQHQKVSYDSEADASSHSLTISEPVEGRLMILVACGSAVLDTPSGWSLAVSATNDPDVRIFYRIAPAGFGTSVQFGSAFSCSASAVYMEYSPFGVSPLDQTANQPSIASTGTTGTTTQAAELLIGAIGVGGSTTDGNWSAWSNSFVEEHDLASSGGGTNVSLGVSSLGVAATGTYSTGATAAGGSGPCGCIATFKIEAASSNVTGTVAETQDAQTSSASGVLGYTGTSAQTQTNQTSSASGTVSGTGVDGTVAVTQTAQTSTATGQLGYTGTSVRTQANQTSTAAGILGYSGTVARTQAAQTSTASGTVGGIGEVTGTLAETQDAQTSTATGQLGSSGVLAASQANQTATAAGWITITGAVAETQDSQTASAAGNLGATGTLARTQANQTVTATGWITVTGLVARTQANQTCAATGFVGVIPIPAGHPLTVPSATHQVTAGGGHRVTAPSRPTALEVS